MLLVRDAMITKIIGLSHKTGPVRIVIEAQTEAVANYIAKGIRIQYAEPAQADTIEVAADRLMKRAYDAKLRERGL